MKKGYYSWFRSLNSAAINAQAKAFEMLHEEKAKKITGAKAEQIVSKLSSQGRFAPPKTGSHGNFSIEDEQGMPVMDISLQKAGSAIGSMMGELGRAGTPGFEAPSESSISAAGGDAAEFARIRASKSQKDSKPVDVNMDGKVTANDVAMDVSDNKIDGMVLPQDRVHPEPWYKTPEEANAAAKELSSYYSSAEPDEDEYKLSTPSRDWKIFKEDRYAISDKISKILRD